MSVIAASDPKGGIARGTIAMCVRDKVSAQTAISMMMIDYSFLGPDEYVSRYIIQGNVLTMQRNECVRMMQGDWILFIDADMVWRPQDIHTIIETRDKFDLDIVGGLCFQRGDPFQPTLYIESPDGESGYTFLEQWPENTAVEVDATGLAFCLIHKRVFDRILMASTGQEMPTFEERKHMMAPPFFKWTGQLGEDFQFCKEAKATGSRVWVDTSIKIGHIGEVTIDEKMFLLEIAQRSDEGDADRAAQLEAIGYKAETREGARRRLGWTK